LKENKPAFDIIDINRNALVVAKTALKLGIFRQNLITYSRRVNEVTIGML
tara:strand:- start:1147 stop:1296 length:150 start_codon:yes stop_codon:yes gene_type:complete